MTIDVQTECRLIPADGGSRRHLWIRFTAPEAPARAARKPANVALVMDRSGSMGGAKIELVREAVRKALAMLRSDDRFALVVYDDRIDVLVESTHASAEALRNAVERLSRIDARGQTNLADGWLRGCEQIGAHLAPELPGRCLLLTDGLANVGITDRDELARHAAQLRARGVTTSTFGVGADFDERLLNGMAVAGGGHSYYIETPVQIPDLLTSELGETLEVTAHDVAVEITAPPGTAVACLNEFSVRSLAGGISVELGGLTSRQEVSLVAALDLPPGEIGARVEALVRLRDRAGVLPAEPVRPAWTFASRAASDAEPRDRAVDRAVAELYAARARREALELNRAGAYERATLVLVTTSEKILGYAGDDAILNRLARELTEERREYAAPMMASDLKARYYSSQQVMQMRDPSGKAKRRSG
jgi:Ca-activated chloride channel family protein